MTRITCEFFVFGNFMRESFECLGRDALGYRPRGFIRSDRHWRLRRLLNAARRESGKSAENE